MFNLIKATAIATTLGVGMASGGMAQAAGLASPALGSASVSVATQSDVHLAGGRYWKRGHYADRRWHRGYRRGPGGAAVALGAVGLAAGLAATANAYPYGYGPPVVYMAPGYPAPAYGPPGYSAPVYGDPAYGPDVVYADPEDDLSYDDGSDAEAYGSQGYGEDVEQGSASAYSPPPPPVQPRRQQQSAQVAYAGSASGATSGGTPAPWTKPWYSYCYDKFKSFNAETGYYTSYAGEQKFCR